VIIAGANSIFNVPFISNVSQVGTPLTVPPASVSGGGDTGAGNNSSGSVGTPNVAAGAPDLIVAISQPNPSPVAGQTSLIPVTVSNIGNGPSQTEITVSVNIPTGTTFGTFPTNNNGWACSTSATTAVCKNSAVIIAGANSIFSVPFISNVSQVGTPLTILPASVSGGGDTSAGNNSSDQILTLNVTAPDITITISNPNPNPVAGQTSSIPVTVSNIGDGPSEGEITAIVAIPTGTTFGTFPTNNNGWACSANGTTAVCKNSAVIIAGANSIFNVPFISNVSQVGTPLTVPPASVSGGGDTGAGNNSSGSVGTPNVTGVANLEISLSAPTTGTINTNFQYLITITNTGSLPSNGTITIKSTLPDGIAFLTGSGGANWSCSAIGQVVTCNSSGLSIPVGSQSSITLTVTPTNSGTFTNVVTIIGGGDPSLTPKSSNSVTTTVGLVGVLSIKALLQGPFDPATGLMSDALRVQSLIPLTQPYGTLPDFNYSGTENISSNLLTVTGNNAIVDWVMVEVRSASNPSTVVARRSALIQRDGDIVDTDGISAVTFSGISGSYYVSIRHRNHLGVMTGNTVVISSTPTSVNFTSNVTANYSISSPYAQYTVINGPSAGTRTMWAGNASADNNVIFQGPGSDIDYIFSNVYFANILGNANFISTSYSRTDFNLDGNTIYQGPDSDTDIVFFNILYYYLGNAGQLPNSIITQQIP
jgi:hypothetical protein